MAQKVRVEVDKDLWDETPWLWVGPLLHGVFSYQDGIVHSPYVGAPALHFYWDNGWNMAAPPRQDKSTDCE